MIRLVSPRSRTKSWVLVVLLLLLVVTGTVAYLAWRQSVPGVRVTGSPPRLLGQKTAFALVAEAARGNIARMEVRLVQNGARAVIGTAQGPLGRRVEVPVAVEPAAAGIREGGATVEVWARDDFWRPWRRTERPVATFPVTVDLTPPKLDVLATTPYVAPGGAGVVVVRAPDAARVDVRVGGLGFPAFALGPDGTRVAFFALPYDFAARTPLAVLAQDEAGNSVSRGLTSEVLPRRFRRDRIEVKEAFLQAKVPELLPQRPPSQPLVEAFLTINRDQRRQAEETKRRVGATTAPKLLWEGPFVQPRNTKVFSNFAETRTYLYQGREIDTQVHFGYDLASTKQAAVPAANRGVVVFAEPLTIYGNTVIVDHGLGLMTLYGHLSAIGVKVGDAVERGQEIGRTGMTGLAIGDHLHYEVLVHGVSVTPLEWWDAKWIQDRVTGPLEAAGIRVTTGNSISRSSAGNAGARNRP
jgi:murein DD-endopeptidase MepM/ murein hydrolase activator NlpD